MITRHISIGHGEFLFLLNSQCCFLCYTSDYGLNKEILSKLKVLKSNFPPCTNFVLSCVQHSLLSNCWKIVKILEKNIILFVALLLYVINFEQNLVTYKPHGSNREPLISCPSIKCFQCSHIRILLKLTELSDFMWLTGKGADDDVWANMVCTPLRQEEEKEK